MANETVSFANNKLVLGYQEVDPVLHRPLQDIILDLVYTVRDLEYRIRLLEANGDPDCG